MKNRWFLSVFLLLILLTQMIMPCAATEGGETASESVQEIEHGSDQATQEAENGSDASGSEAAQEAPTAQAKEGFEPPAPLIEYNFPSDYQVRAKAAVLPNSLRFSNAVAETVRISSRFPYSSASIQVMIFVRLAGYSRSSS